MNRIAQYAVAILVVLALAAPAPVGAQKRPINEQDFLKFKWIADPRISPDGKQVAYVLVEVNEKEDRYDTSLWSVNTSGAPMPRRLTAGPRDSAPRWSPDSRTLAFNRAAEREAPQIYLLTMSGGEARKLTDVARGASPANWSPDGRTIAFTSSATPEDIEEKKKGGPPAKKSDVRVITRAVYRFNGAGYIDPARVSHHLDRAGQRWHRARRGQATHLRQVRRRRHRVERRRLENLFHIQPRG